MAPRRPAPATERAAEPSPPDVSAQQPAPAQVQATPSGPQIYSVHATPSIVHSGDSVVWDVRTTPDVVSVDVQVSLYALQMVKQSAGHFALNFAIPSSVPWFFHGTYDLDVRAHTQSGEVAHRSISLTFE
jgi:hypothetical protein